MAATTGSGADERVRVAERLGALLARKVSGTEAAQFATFAAQLLGRGQGYVRALPEEEAAQLILSAFRFFQAPGASPRVRAITPTYADEGWDAPCSVIETCLADRPFVIDTIRDELRAQGVEVRALLHPIFGVVRDASGRIERLDPPTHGASRESFLHVAVARITDRERLTRLAEAIRARLDDVVLVTEDYGPQLARAQAMAAEFEQLGRSRDPRLAAEATAVGDFLRWLVDGAFVFLGYREYAFLDAPAGRSVQVRAGSGLGLLRREERSAFRESRPVADLPPAAGRRASGTRLLTVGKTHALSPVHRRVPMDDLGFAALDAAGNVVGERRLLGLFTSKAHAEEASEIPVLRRMLRQILAAEQVISGSHDWKEIVAVFNTIPKAELFAASADDIRGDIRTIVAAERTNDVVVTIRESAEGERLAVLVVMPRSRVSGEARARVAALVSERLGVTLLVDHLHVGAVDGAEGAARLHLSFTRGSAPLDASTRAGLQAAIDAVLESWTVQLREALVARAGADEGTRLALRYADAFPDDYRATTPIERAVDDVLLAERAARARGVVMVLDPEPLEGASVLRVYLAGEPLVLTDFLPSLDHAGLRTLSEDRVRLRPADGTSPYVHRFLVHDRVGRPLDVRAVEPRLTEALLAVRTGRVPDDGLNRLAIEAGLDWRAIDALRAYAAYAVQAGLGARSEVWDALARNPEPARRLFACIASRFQPGAEDADAPARFLASVEAVESLREDRCLRGLLALVQATVRTNVFARAADCDRLVLKLRAADVSFLSEPRPLYEVYVRAPGVEGLHLRAGLVARGGIRLSDRPEDFRTEVLGLMRTQTMKNAIIVPTGAKGAFVVQAGVAPLDAYRTFIRGLLDVTDNVEPGGRVVHPPGLRIYDEEDAYLVVAADKGTASFSDEANAIAAEYGFWLGDAFASGGSHGYDHKALGITALGAWECVRTHFREMDVDADTAPLRVIGIGDMAGDVFGNGLLRSPHLRLVAAFNHRHIFIDPDPDPAASFAERQRLFRAGAGWDAYDPAVRSPGGLVALRSAKRVGLTSEARRLLGVTEEALSGEAVVRAILTAEADLLWNGGIGTYVRAPDESDAAVGDPANDAVRVTSSALRVRVVAEGGNLGMTQRGRVAFALAGGHVNMDAIDNSAGVDMSDHEVNLKICLAPVVAAGRLTVATRNALLEGVRDDVVAHVLAHNTNQSRLLGVDRRRSVTRLEDFRELMADLERTTDLSRGQAGLPDWETLRARRGTYPGLTRPELAVLTAFTKIRVQSVLRAAPLVDDPLLASFLIAYFPSRIATELADAVRGHRLRREITAAQAANALVDELGVTFLHRVQHDTGTDLVGALRAWAIARTLVDGGTLWRAIGEARLAFADEITCVLGFEAAVASVTRWVVAHDVPSRSAAEVATELVRAVEPVRARLPGWVGGPEAEAFHRRRAQLEMAGLAPDAARALVGAEWLAGALDVVAAARDAGAGVEVVGRRYYALGAELDFAWLGARLAEQGDVDRWTRRALEGAADDLRAARRRLAMRGDAMAGALAAVRGLLDDVKATEHPALAALLVVVREIRRVAETPANGSNR